MYQNPSSIYERNNANTKDSQQKTNENQKTKKDWKSIKITPSRSIQENRGDHDCPRKRQMTTKNIFP